MKILKFVDYIKEGIDDKYRGFSTIGEFLESVYEQDDYIKDMINSKISNIDTDIRVSNAINTLSNYDKNFLYKNVCDFIDGNEIDSNIKVTTSVNENQETIASGKGVFKTFLRLLTSLGLKENSPSWDKCPNDFILYYEFNDVLLDKLKGVMSRFKSLSLFMERLSGENVQKLYFGIKTDLNFEYGILSDEHNYMGKFKMTKSNYNWLMLSDVSSSSSLKRELADLSVDKLALASKIKMDMATFTPGKSSRSMLPVINNNIITFGYYGVGKWEDGELSEEDMLVLKDNFIQWASKKRWSSKVMMSITSSDFWIYFKIKMK